MARPSIKIDLRQLEALAQIQCTHDEIAAVLSLDKRTLIRHLKKPDIKAAYDRGKNSGKASLRRVQWKSAMDGNPTMQIWLGKNLLNQTDRLAMRSTTALAVEDNRTAPDEYDNMSTDDLRTMADIMERAKEQRTEKPVK